MRFRFLLLAITLALIVQGTNDFVPFYTIDPPEKSSAIGSEEDPMARANYEFQMLADPGTGSIPANIRRRELVFSKHIPDKLSFLQKSGQRINLNNYQLAGPNNVGGRTRAAAFDIQNENIIIAGGVSGGIWKSINGGTEWYRTSDPLNRNSITSLTQDERPGKENIWYHSSGELISNSASTPGSPYRGSGIYKSTNNGESWDILESTRDSPVTKFGSQFQYAFRITTNPNNLTGDEVLVAAFGGILKSEDGGESWSVVLGQELFNLDDSVDLNCSTAPFYTEIQRTEGGKFFAALSGYTSSIRLDCESNSAAASAGYYYSEDGSSWEEITPPNLPEEHRRTVIGFSADETKIYFLAHTSSDEEEEENEVIQLWKFNLTNYLQGNSIASSWQDLSDNIPRLGGSVGDYDAQGGYNMLIQGHPENNNVLFMGGTNLYRSSSGFEDSGSTDWIGGYSSKNNRSQYTNHHPDQHLLIFYPSNTNRMISAHDGGLSETSNNLTETVQWKNLNNGYLTSQFYSVAQEQTRPTDAIIGGMQDNGTFLRNGADIESPVWYDLLSGDGGYSAITPNQIFYYSSFQRGQVYRMTLSESNQLTSFARVDPMGAGEDVALLFVNPYILDPENANRMYFTGGDVLWRNDNLSQISSGSNDPTSVNWRRIAGTKISSGVYTSIAKSNIDDILLAGVYADNTRVVKVNNASGNDYESERIQSSLFPTQGYISCIAINPNDADHFLVIFSNYNVRSIIMTEDGGTTFTDVSGNLEEFPDGSGSGPSVRWAQIIPTKSGLNYFVGTSTGLYSTALVDGLNTQWVKESEELIGNSIITMMDYRPVDGRLIIGTHGNGTFRGFIEDAIPYDESENPSKVSMAQNYPNPFSDITYLEFDIPESDVAKIDIYNSAGQFVKTLLWSAQFAGKNRVSWDGTNTSGGQLRAGIYYAVLTYGNKKITKSMIYQP